MENKQKLISDYNARHSTEYDTITDIYNHAGSTRKAAKRLAVSPCTISKWVKAEGGKVNCRGGNNRASKLYGAVESIPAKELYDMQYRQVAKMIGTNISWAGVLKRRRMMEIIDFYCDNNPK